MSSNHRLPAQCERRMPLRTPPKGRVRPGWRSSGLVRNGGSLPAARAWGPGCWGRSGAMLELRRREERLHARARRWLLRAARERSSTASRDENPREPAVVSSDAVDDEILAVVARCLLGLEQPDARLVARRSVDVASRRWVFPALWAPRGLGSIKSVIDASEGIAVLDGIGSLISRGLVIASC